MLFRRSRSDGPARLSELEPAHKALAEGRYDIAFAVLESAARRPLGRPTQAIYWLHLAAVYALYGMEGLDNGLRALRSAVNADPKTVERPLYQALFWEFAAYQGDPAVDIKRGLREVSSGQQDAVAVYHAASALCAAGALKTSSRMLRELDGSRLPQYLLWRRWSLLGQAQEQLGKFEEASEAFQRAVAGSSGGEQAAERLSLANCLLELGEAHAAEEQLSGIEETILGQEERAFKRYLEGRSQLEQDNPNRALQLFTEARALDQGERASFNLEYATGQSLVAVGRFEEASKALARAVALAPVEHRPFAQHEYAYALVEAERPSDARAQYEEVLADPSYPHRAEAFADLADVHHKIGEYEEAQAAAEQALELEATAPACLVLGNLAYEYFRFDEAIGWFEQVVSASTAGDPAWVSAQQLLAEVYSQQGPEAAEQLFLHANAASSTPIPQRLVSPLSDHLKRAQEMLGGHSRLLN